MAETLVENRVCKSCGADVRPDTVFCYNCGSSLAPETVVASNGVNTTGAIENAAEEKNGNKAEPVENSAVEEVSDTPIPEPNIQSKTELKSAAALRRKPKVFQSKKVEVIWEENNAPNGWFIIAAILLTLLAAGIFWLATYLK